MNPGVQANIVAIVLLILMLFGWGMRTLQDGHLTPRLTSVLLIGDVLTVGWSLSTPSGLRWDVGGVLIPLLLIVWMMNRYKTWMERMQWLMGVLTVASVLIVLMTLMPLDPAFFPVGESVLYPLATVAVAVFSVRRPFAALSIAVVGLALASFIEPLIHGQQELRNIVLEGGETRDMIAYSAAGVLVLHRPYHVCVRYLLRVLRQLFRRQEGGPEHV